MKTRKSNSKDAETLIEMGNCCNLNAFHPSVSMQSLCSLCEFYSNEYKGLLHYRVIYLKEIAITVL